MITICSWPYMVATTTSAKPATASFARIFHDFCEVQMSRLSSPTIKGDTICIKITQDEDEKDLADCKNKTYKLGRLLLNKLGYKLIIVRDDLSTQLSMIWQTFSRWKILRNFCHTRNKTFG
jgi:hypothetical protein